MKSRIENSAKNYLSSVMAQIITVALNLISRTVFIHTLGEAYLGINGLFTNIITIFSLAELGISSAIIYSLYKPIAQQDYKKIAALIRYYKYLYTIIAFVILAIGLAFFPFISFFVNLDVEIPNIRYYYLLFLAQSVSSYLIVYRTAILTADQKEYLITKNNIIGNLATFFIQTSVLLITHSYGLFTLVQIICSLVINYINSLLTLKYYPYIKNKYDLSKNEKKDIWINIKSMFSYKVGGVILNNTDNLLISKLSGTTVLGIYSNYSLIIAKIFGLINMLFTSIQSSLGNYNAENKGNNIYFMFRVISFMQYWIYSVCAIAFCLLMNDFIALWIGSRFVLPNNILYISVLNFYIQGILYPIWCYRNTTGLFRETRFMMFIASGINLFLSIVLGLKLGLFGILVATAISRLCTNLWYEPYILFKKYFNENIYKYYEQELFRIFKIILFILISNYFFREKLLFSNYLVYFCIKIVYCIVVPNILLWIGNRNKQEYLYIYETIAMLIRKHIKNN